MYSVVGNFAPLLTVLIIELINIMLFRENPNIITSLTVINYTNMLFSPITNLPISVILGLQAKTSCFRINHFLNSKDAVDKR